MAILGEVVGLDALGGCRVLALGGRDGSARLAAAVLVDLGARVDAVTSLEGVGHWDVILVDDPEGEQMLGLAARADALLVVLDSLPADGPPPAEGSDLVTQAASGHLLANGAADDPPTPCGAPLALHGAALAAVLAVVAGWHAHTHGEALETVRIDHTDVLRTFLTTLVPRYLLNGHEIPRIGNRHALTAPWNSYPASDGWVVLATMGERQWLKAAKMLGMPHLVDDPRFATADDRIIHVDELDALVAARTAVLTKSELVELGQAHGVPLSEVLDTVEAAGHPQARHREQIGETGGDQRLFFRSLAPASGVSRRLSTVRPAELPLAGLRVVEVGLYTSGPLAGRLLALLGADVLKVEPPNGEPGRQLGSKIEGSSYLYFMNNTDKRGCVLDLTTAPGRDQMAEVLADCDVFLTNLSEETLVASGLSFAEIAASTPGLIYGSISGYGASGPYQGQRVLDTVMQGVAGVMHVTGRADGPPLKTAASACDLLSAWVAAIAVVAAVGDSARARGEAQYLDIALLDAARWLMRRAPEHRQGAADPAFAAHGVFRSNDGVSVAVAVRDEASLARLPGVADLGDWLAATDAADALALLRAHGVPAAAVASPAQAAERLLVTLPLREGTHRVFGSPISWPTRGVRVRSAAPELGADPPEWSADDRTERKRA